MAIINGEILSGKIGGLVFSNYQARQVARNVSRKSNRRPTDDQRAQQLRLGLILNFFAPLKSLVSKGYSGVNKCMSYHLKNAITGVFPNLALSYSEVLLTRGILINACNASVKCLEPAMVNFSWKNLGAPNDEAILVTYNEVRRQHVWLRTSVKRKSKCASLKVPKSFSGNTLHCWIAFIAQDGRQFSDSVYLGTTTIK